MDGGKEELDNSSVCCQVDIVPGLVARQALSEEVRVNRRILRWESWMGDERLIAGVS